MSARGAMIHIAYLKRALHLAAETVEGPNATEEDYQKQIAIWMKAARNPKAVGWDLTSEPPANHVPGRKIGAVQFSRKHSLTQEQMDLDESFDKAVGKGDMQ
jgi:hypothetical protein